jgi:Na+-transporting NADH:ubiquinone oxidoreductase subunit A
VLYQRGIAGVTFLGVVKILLQDYSPYPMKIVIKRGLDIPLQGKPRGSLQDLPTPKHISLNLNLFEEMRFRLLVKVGESVQIGQPLLESKVNPGQLFVSPAGGVVSEIRRGAKRQLENVVIQLQEEETYWQHERINYEMTSRDAILAFFMRTGLFPHLRLRPFSKVPHLGQLPRDIFVTALETLPFEPSQEMQVEGYEDYFQLGLQVLAKITTGKVHLVYSKATRSAPFLQAKNVEHHTVSGPHPAGSSSVHIHFIAPIQRHDDFVWTLAALDVVVIGKMMLEGQYHPHRVLSIAGTGIEEGKRGFFRGRMGYPMQELIANRLIPQSLCFIAGNPLTGFKTDLEGFLGFGCTCFSVIPETATREAFHFLRLGAHKFSATGAYLSGHQRATKGLPFTTNQHGEERAFIDPVVYDRVMPMRIPTVFLIKAILAEDFELAEHLGLLEVVPEDFALPTFICPSKIEMIDIVRKGLRLYAQEMGV